MKGSAMDASELFAAWAAACVKKDTDAMANLYTEDATHTFAFRRGTPVVEGREAIRAMLANGLGKAPIRFTGISMSTVHRTQDPHTVIVECTFDGETADGRAYQPSYVEVLTERGGLIAAVRDYENLAYRTQEL
jgi:uncharacterized protein